MARLKAITLEHEVDIDHHFLGEVLELAQQGDILDWLKSNIDSEDLLGIISDHDIIKYCKESFPEVGGE